VHAVGCFATIDVWRVPRDLQATTARSSARSNGASASFRA